MAASVAITSVAAMAMPDSELGEQGNDKPRTLAQRFVGVEETQQHEEENVVKAGADQSENEHEAMDVPDILILRAPR